MCELFELFELFGKHARWARKLGRRESCCYMKEKLSCLMQEKHQCWVMLEINISSAIMENRACCKVKLDQFDEKVKVNLFPGQKALWMSRFGRIHSFLRKMVELADVQ